MKTKMTMTEFAELNRDYFQSQYENYLDMAGQTEKDFSFSEFVELYDVELFCIKPNGNTVIH